MRVAAAAALLCLGAAGCQQPAPSVRVERTVVLMGTTARFAADAADRDAALARLERMVRVVEATEAELSTWRNDSALSELNRQPPGETRAVPAALCGLLGRLEGWQRATAGAFDPAIGSLIDAWGLRAAGRRPGGEELHAARGRAGWRRLGFDREVCSVTRKTDVRLDAGAFGKGEALRRLVEVSAGGDPWMVDFGGQIAVGGKPAGAGWPVAIAHPARRHQAALALTLTTGSLATSAASERSRVVDGRPVAHILDPRTGQPIHRPESVTVWHEDPLAADVLSTALYVMGADEGLDHAERHGLAALFLVPDSGRDAAPVTIRASRMFETRFPAVVGASAS